MTFRPLPVLGLYKGLLLHYRVELKYILQADHLFDSLHLVAAGGSTALLDFRLPPTTPHKPVRGSNRYSCSTPSDDRLSPTTYRQRGLPLPAVDVAFDVKEPTASIPLAADTAVDRPLTTECYLVPATRRIPLKTQT